jgi:hypothetical protein
MKKKDNFKEVYRITLNSSEKLPGSTVYNQSYILNMPVTIKRGRLILEHFWVECDANYFTNVASIYLASKSICFPNQYTSFTAAFESMSRNVFSIVPTTVDRRISSNLLCHHDEISFEHVGVALPKNFSFDNFKFDFTLYDNAGIVLDQKAGPLNITRTGMTLVIVDDDANNGSVIN